MAAAPLRRRSRISSAAVSVKVHNTISFGSASPAVSRWSVRRMSVSVLPALGPAISRSGPSVAMTASRRASFRSSSNSGNGSAEPSDARVEPSAKGSMVGRGCGTDERPQSVRPGYHPPRSVAEGPTLRNGQRCAPRPPRVLRPERERGAYALNWAYAPRSAWSWGESNPRPSVSVRTRYDHSRPRA